MNSHFSLSPVLPALFFIHVIVHTDDPQNKKYPPLGYAAQTASAWTVPPLCPGGVAIGVGCNMPLYNCPLTCWVGQLGCWSERAMEDHEVC